MFVRCRVIIATRKCSVNFRHRPDAAAGENISGIIMEKLINRKQTSCTDENTVNSALNPDNGCFVAFRCPIEIQSANLQDQVPALFFPQGQAPDDSLFASDKTCVKQTLNCRSRKIRSHANQLKPTFTMYCHASAISSETQFPAPS